MTRALLVLAALLVPAVASAKTPAEMEPLTWMSVPNTRLDSVQADPKLYADLQGNGFYTVVDAWNGAVVDTNRLRLVVWGGGHNDYYGNEMYAFDIEALQWMRLTDPTVEWNNCGDPNADGTANARHTYNGMQYVEHADRFFVSGGALNCTSGSCGADITWEFDFDTLTWTDRQATGDHSTMCENMSAYDPTTGTIYFGDVGGLYAYAWDDNTWTQLNQEYIYGKTGAIDPERGILVMVGGGEVFRYDIAGGDFEAEVSTAPALGGSTPGFVFDPQTDLFVAWNGGAVQTYDPDSGDWTEYDVPGAPEPTQQGIYGRWNYVPGVNAFILVTATDVDVHFFKLSEGGMIPEGESDGSSSGDGGGSESGTPDPDTGSATSGATASGSTSGPTSSGGSSDGPATDGATSGPATEDEGDGGCGCRTSTPASAWLLLLALGLRRRFGIEIAARPTTAS